MRRGDVRHWSPPQSRFRNREYSPPRRTEIGERLFDRSLGSVTNESQRSSRIDRGGGSSARRDYEDIYRDIDRDRDMQSRRLSEFNEGLARVESTAMKFQWKQLLGEPNKYSNETNSVNPSLDRGIDGYAFNGGGTGRNYQDIRYSDTNQKNYEDIGYSDKSLKSYEGTSYSDTNLKSYEDTRYPNHKNNLKSYEDTRYSDKSQKNYEDIRYPDTNLKSYEDTRYSNTNLKSYEDVRKLDISRPGILFEKSSSMGADRAKSYSFYSPDVGLSAKGSGHLDDGYKLSSLNLNVGLHEEEPYSSSSFQPYTEKLLVDESPAMKYKSPAREYYKEKRNSLLYSKEILDYSKLPFSGSKATGKKSLGLMEEDSLGRNGYGQESRSKSFKELYDKRDLNYSYHSPKDEEIGDYDTYVNGRRSVRDHIGTVSEDFHATMPSFGEKYSRQDSLRNTSIVDPIVERLEECSDREQFNKPGLCDHGLSSEGLESPNYLEATRIRKQDRKVLGFGSTNGEYKTEVYEDHGSLLSGESDDYERDGDYWTHEDSCKNLSMEEYDPYLDEMGGGSSRAILKRKRGVDTKSSMLKFGNKSSRWIHDDGFAGERRTDEDRKLIFSSKKSKSLIPRHLSKPHSSSRGNDIKNRLGPCPKKSHDSRSSLKFNKSSLKKRLGPRPDDSYRSSVQKCKSLLKKRLGPHPNNSGSSLGNGKSLLKKRLGPRPQNRNRVPLPWLNPERFNQHRRLTRKSQIDDAGKKSQIDDVEEEGDSSEGSLTNEKAEPREDSEEFKLMVDHVFFRYVKLLNENSDKRRRYIEQGEDGKLKCSICGRSVFYAMICLYKYIKKNSNPVS